jgi:hypothetical protein
MHVTDALRDAAVARSLSNPGRTIFLVTGDELSESERADARRLVGAHFDCAVPNGPTACFHVAPSERDARQSLAKWYRLPHFPSQLMLTDARFRVRSGRIPLVLQVSLLCILRCVRRMNPSSFCRLGRLRWRSREGSGHRSWTRTH